MNLYATATERDRKVRFQNGGAIVEETYIRNAALLSAIKQAEEAIRNLVEELGI